jgi:hypothetical protein
MKGKITTENRNREVLLACFKKIEEGYLQGSDQVEVDRVYSMFEDTPEAMETLCTLLADYIVARVTSIVEKGLVGVVELRGSTKISEA